MQLNAVSSSLMAPLAETSVQAFLLCISAQASSSFAEPVFEIWAAELCRTEQLLVKMSYELTLCGTFRKLFRKIPQAFVIFLVFHISPFDRCPLYGHQITATYCGCV